MNVQLNFKEKYSLYNCVEAWLTCAEFYDQNICKQASNILHIKRRMEWNGMSDMAAWII